MTAEDLLIKKCLEHENRYVSFPSLIENEGSVEANSVALESMEEYAQIKVKEALDNLEYRDDNFGG